MSPVSARDKEYKTDIGGIDVKNRRRIISIAVTTALCFTMAGYFGFGHTPSVYAATKKASNNGIYYWISQNTTLPLFVQNDYKGMKLIEKQLGITIRIAGPTNINLPQLITTINEVCAQHPAGVSVVGWDPSETAAVNKCIAEGVPVVTDDADLPQSNRLGYIGEDWYDIGVAQAKAMIQATGGHGQVAMLSIINSSNMISAVQGFEATIKGTGLKLVANENDGGSALTAESVTGSLLAAHPHLAGIAGFDSESGPGIVEALTSAHMIGKVKVTAMEQTPAFFKTVKDGAVSAIIVQKREMFTYYAFLELWAFNHSGLATDGLKGWQAPAIPAFTNTGLMVVTKKNVNQVLKADKVN